MARRAAVPEAEAVATAAELYSGKEFVPRGAGDAGGVVGKREALAIAPMITAAPVAQPAKAMARRAVAVALADVTSTVEQTTLTVTSTLTSIVPGPTVTEVRWWTITETLYVFPFVLLSCSPLLVRLVCLLHH